MARRHPGLRLKPAWNPPGHCCYRKETELWTTVNLTCLPAEKMFSLLTRIPCDTGDPGFYRTGPLEPTHTFIFELGEACFTSCVSHFALPANTPDDPNITSHFLLDVKPAAKWLSKA